MDDARKRLVVIAGPTAVGKTEISLQVAEALDGEIISADSAAVYRGLDIGTAKPLPADLARVPHHGLNLVDADEPFSVADFQRAATRAIEAIWERGRRPVIVGGTGLWIRALLRNYQLSADAEPGPLRERLARTGAQDGFGSLRRQLRVVDPASYAAIAANDHRRLVRAMEVFQSTGRVLVRSQADSPVYPCVYWVLTRSVAELHERIARRIDAMLAQGLADEVGHLLRAGVPPRAQSLSAIGYREMVDWWYGLTTALERDALIRRHSNLLAKRQLTWFRSEKEARWLDLSAWPIDAAVGKIVASAQQ